MSHIQKAKTLAKAARSAGDTDEAIGKLIDAVLELVEAVKALER
jgi:hypothetical protein